MFTFANPLFLWGLLGLAAPVLIHLINRDLFRPLHFPSLRFILRGKLPVERKRRLRDLFLLALRMLLFAVIVTALARPQWQSAAVPTATGETDTELVVLIDASASMSGWGSWEEAVAQAEETLAAHSSSPAALVVSGAGPLLVEPLTTDHARLRDLLARSKPKAVAGDHREAFRQTLRLFENGGQRVLAVISDFQQSDWSPTSLPEVDPELEVEWIQVGGNERENAGILHARALPLPEGRRQVVVEVKNFGQREMERTLKLNAGEESLTRNVQLAPGQTRTVSFVLQESSASRAEISLDADALPTDDHYFLWLARPPPIRVLAIAPTTEEPEKAEELFFLTRALSTQTETQWLRFAVDAVEPGAVTSEHLQNVETIFLLGAAPYLEDSEWGLLRNHLQDGGRLLFTPGKAPARQITLLADRGFIDLSYEGATGLDYRQTRPHHIGWVQPDSALDLLFRDEAARSLGHVSIFRYAQLGLNDKSDAEVLLRADTEAPLLVQRPLDSGSVLVTAFPFETSWTDLPVSTAFLPMIRELVAGNLPPDHGIIKIDTGANPAAIAGRLNLPADSPALAKIDPFTPAIHLVGDIPVILNSPRSESLPATTNPVDLQTAVSPRVSTDSPNVSSAVNGAAKENTASLSLWPWLAIAALLLFIIEMPLAARLRRRTGPASGPTAEPEATTSRSS